MSELIHTCYRILDIDRSVAFYEKLGFEELARMPIRDEAVNVFMGLPDDGARLELTWNKDSHGREMAFRTKESRVNEKLVDLLLPNSDTWDPEKPEENERQQRSREKMKARLEAGELEDRPVELNVEQKAVPVQIFSNLGMENMDVDFQNMFEKIMPKQKQDRQVTIKEARKILLEQETEALIG